MKKRIYVLNGHPGGTSLSKRLSEVYAQAAIKAGHDVRLTHLHDLTFDPDFGEGSYKTLKPLEDDLKAVVANLGWSEHVVLLTPMWWGGVPAKLKGLFDRVLLPGFAFDPRQKRLGLPKPLLAGRTARLIMTSDTPDWFFRLAYGRAMVRQLRGQVFGFVGIKPLRVTHFAAASHPAPKDVERWSEAVAVLGRAAR
ncbi:NAD(P)H-dependent oxidoreductase [Ponticoccus alexandrii]|uniref:Flavodoxin family protein n=1 Tax=Ponticoccus alexandrii TaxID=1943633 RepID=A0ABX7F7M3_9RHOB|nr:NAD(P)H-dependent oxidoreductase [Ponticoccus alexandrii]ETA51489.1 NAD(P)H dehydrogenase [Rhodobacteraceae bacterium PD-2]QRF66530.1 flavodoxin family protein [Ponticoccus alexandrii]